MSNPSTLHRTSLILVSACQGAQDGDATVTVVKKRSSDEVVILARRRGRWRAFRGKEPLLPETFDALHGPFLGLFRARRGTQLLWFNGAGQPVNPADLRNVAPDAKKGSYNPTEEPIDDRLTPEPGSIEVVVLEDPPLEHTGIDDLPDARSLVITNTKARPVIVASSRRGRVLVRVEEFSGGAWRRREDLDAPLGCTDHSEEMLAIRPGHQRVDVARLPRSALGTFRFVAMVDDTAYATAPVYQGAP
jgi:hypothetical protein